MTDSETTRSRRTAWQSLCFVLGVAALPSLAPASVLFSLAAVIMAGSSALPFLAVSVVASGLSAILLIRDAHRSERPSETGEVPSTSLRRA